MKAAIIIIEHPDQIVDRENINNQYPDHPHVFLKHTEPNKGATVEQVQSLSETLGGIVIFGGGIPQEALTYYHKELKLKTPIEPKHITVASKM